jgi:predicted RNA methylase
VTSTTQDLRKWTNVSAGPRQVKDLMQAVSALQMEGRTRNELYGVVGGNEHSSAVVDMFGPVRDEVSALDEEIRERYGYLLTKDNIRAVTADYAAALPRAAQSRLVQDNRRSAEEDAKLTAVREAQTAEREAAQSASAALLAQVMSKAPAGAKALIYAELHQDVSDPQTDYFGTRVTRTVAIGFRTSSREDFKALRAAAGSFPETAGMAADPDAEHRDNHSMGAGNYLSDHGWAGSGSGWLVRSRDIPCTYLSLTEDAVPEPQAAPAPVSGPRRDYEVVPGFSPVTYGDLRSSGVKPARAKAVSTSVLDVLATAETDGRSLKIGARLDRETYVKVADVLKAAGGKWNRGAQAFLFGEDAAPVLAKLLDDGSVVRPQDEGWFPTPAPVVARMLELAGLAPGMEVLEPSAGEGAIASAVAAAGCVVDCIEQNAKRAAVTYAAGCARSVTMADFLALPARQAYDAVLMNPPFADKADIAHVRHAEKFVRSGGTLAAVMSRGVMFREDRETADFRRSWVKAGGTFEPLPDDAFKASDTGVRTVLAVITI